jgi:hypothetical protein
MEVNDLSSLSLFPLCLHTDNKTFFSHISNPELIKKDDKNFLNCPKGENEKVEIFYAIIPAFVPIPVDTTVIAAKNSITLPKYTIEIKSERDPNVSVLANKVSFITWTKKIPYTVPLYLHRLKDKVYPSFDIKHADIGNDEDWTDELISPLYVIPEYVSVKNDNEIKNIPGYKLGFSCYQKIRCILDPNSKDSLLDCSVKCNQIKPENIFEYILSFLSQKISTYDRLMNTIKSLGKIPDWIILFLFILFFVALIILIKKIIKR